MANEDNIMKIEQEEKVKKPYKPTYELKPLEADHIFDMVEIINLIGFDEIKNIISPEKISGILQNLENKEKAKEECEGEEKKKVIDDIFTEVGINVGLKAAAIVLKNLNRCKRNVYALLASVSKFSVDEIRHIRADKFLKLLNDFFHKEEFADFFGAAGSFLE